MRRAVAPLLVLSAFAWASGCRGRSSPEAPAAKRAAVAAAADTAAGPAAVAAESLATPTPDVLDVAQRGSFDAFYVAFRAAVARHDADAVRRVLSPSVTSSFGEERTPAAFFRTYPLDDPRSPAWDDLAALLDGPSGEDDGVRVFPSAAAAEPPAALADQYPDAELLAVTRPAPVRTPGGDVIADLSPGQWLPMCDVDDAPDEMMCVVLPDGRTGLAPAAALFHPLGLRLGFGREGGLWRLLYLVAGD